MLRQTIREYQADQRQQYLDIGDPNFVCDFQLNLQLTTEHTGSTHIIFPTSIKLLKGPAACLLHQNDMDTISGNITELWMLNTNHTDSISEVTAIQLHKSCRTKLIALLLFLLIILVFVLILEAEMDVFIPLLCILSVFIVVVAYGAWLYLFHYPKYINKIRSIWRTQFLDLMVEYIDELQLNYNISNNCVRDFRFVMLYPQKRPMGVDVGKYWLYIRVTNGVSNHDGYNLFHVGVAEFIEGDGDDIAIQNEGDYVIDNAGNEGEQQPINSGKPIVSNLGTPLLED
eukprot:551464_1